MNKKFSENEILLLIEDYKNGTSFKKISTKYNCCVSTVRKLIKNSGCFVYKKYNINQKCLDTLVPNSAYLLGFFFADGCMSSGNKLIINLKKDDYDILNKLAYIFSPNQKDLVKFKTKFLHSTNKYYEQCCISFRDKILYQRMLHWGCEQRKSLTLKFSLILENELDKQNTFFHFLRGISDGDGCIYIDKNISKNGYRKIYYNLIGSHDFILSMQRKIKELININCAIYKRKKNSLLSLRRQNDVMILLSYIYDNSNLRLERKYNKFQEIKYMMENKKR